MAWLTRQDDVLAAVHDRREEWASSGEGVVVLRGLLVVARPGQAADEKGAFDVAWCRVESGGDVERLEVVRLAPGRRRPILLGLSGRVLVLARAGALSRWGLAVGDHLEVRA